MTLNRVPLTDGVIRDALAELDGRQFVFDNDGNPVYGVWIYITEPDPIIVPTPKSTGP